MKDNNRLHTADQSRNVPKLMVLQDGLEQEVRRAEYDDECGPPPVLQPGTGKVYHSGSDWAGGEMESL